jgi:V/A-type H+-transporting ATPase subunit I
LVKKVTIITPPEYESLILESFGRSGAIQLKEVSGVDLDWLRRGSERVTDYKALYQEIHPRYLELSELSDHDIKRVTPSIDDFKSFVAAPDVEANIVLEGLESLLDRLKGHKETQDNELKQVVDEIQDEVAKHEMELRHQEEAISDSVASAKAKLESVRALEPEELKNCFAVGVVKNELIPKIEEYLHRYPDLLYKAVGTSSDESLLFVFGSEEGRKWVESLFLVFGIKDVFDVLDTGDVLLVLDPKKRDEVIKKYQEEFKLLEEGEASQAEMKSARETFEKLKGDYNKRLSDIEEKHAKENTKLRGEQGEALGKIAYMDYLLGILSDDNAPVMRTQVISVIQGWIPENKQSSFNDQISALESEIGEKLFVQFEEPSSDDSNIPNPEPEMPKILQPTWTLTKLRGWPSVMEVNPNYITVLIFSFQFGLMYGDIGQGLIFLILGFYLSRKSTRGLSYRVGGLMVPMGISAIIFGFAYDSVFLIEHGISHWLHDAHITLPFHYPIMPNPVLETTKLMLLVFQIAMLEIVFGLILGAYNQIKAGNPVGAIGEHGLGMILYVIGLYQTAMYFISIGMDFMAALGSPWFLVCIAGMLLSFLEPVIHSVQHGHGIGMEAIGEGVGGLLMTFVEGLANMFSFLRIAAFALAHASLAIAAEALTHSLGIAGIGLVVMNIIALSFEMISSSVQSLRLLYYEFMGKFYQGDGIPFRPFRLRSRARGN